jgi:hypothetical protein
MSREDPTAASHGGVIVKNASQKIATELRRVSVRHRAGLVTDEKARQQTAILIARLKATEQTEIARALDAIQAAMEKR